MRSYKEQIESKYKKIAKIPEWLLSFTEPIRKEAIGYLDLSSGSCVMDVGCGTGASFPYLEDVVGEGGKIIGIEPSTSMIAVARDQVRSAGWVNIFLYENTIEEMEENGQYDGALLFAMHDVFNSPEGLKKIHSLLRDGARLVCVGPKLQDHGFTKILNPMLKLLFKRMALSQENRDKPWRYVAGVFTTEKIIEEKQGLIFIYVGRK
jgi:ubiquinone/menaquinone biosynthesis C-methylase UbiE